MAMTNEEILLRFVAFSWPLDNEQTATLVTINGRTPAGIVLTVRSAGVRDAGARHLAEAGFIAEYDERDPQFSVYQLTVTRATIDDLVDFVEWAFLVVIGAPLDYAPKIIPATREAAQASAKGCAKSCFTVIKVAFWIIAALFLLIVLFS